MSTDGHGPARAQVRVAAWLALTGVVVMTLGPAHLRPHLFVDPQAERFLAFGLVGYLLALGHPRRWVLLTGALVVSAAGLEALQLLTPYRHAMSREAVIKALGGVAGVAAVALASRTLPLTSERPR